MTNLNVNQVHEEVFYVTDPIAKVESADIQWLKARALENKREQARLCVHLGVDDAVHEMLIVHTKGTYIRPHTPARASPFTLSKGSWTSSYSTIQGKYFK